jgi:hypothetical protein
MLYTIDLMRLKTNGKKRQRNKEYYKNNVTSKSVTAAEIDKQALFPSFFGLSLEQS